MTLQPFTLEQMGRLLAPWCVRNGVARLEVFGSLGRGAWQVGSDIDLLVSFQPEVRIGWDFHALRDELETLLGCKVDLLTRRAAETDPNPIRRESILSCTRDLYAV